MILRLALSTFLSYDCYAALRGVNDPMRVVPPTVAAVVGVFVLAGLWTPIAGVLVALLECWIAFSRPDGSWASGLAAANALSLACLGPGAWSIDALAYGRKRISIRNR
jgi:uncharacterized membrane protein YphA (DoxX/SURF4 family)